MFIGFIYRLRDAGVPVGVAETLTLAEGMSAGLHGNSLSGFYYAARAILIHHEGHLDAFDQAFLAEFADVPEAVAKLKAEIEQWLDAARERPEVFEQVAGPTSEQLQEWLRLFEARQLEQTERHDGGNYWIGTQGSSPHGQGGSAAAGLSTGSSGGGRAALHVADARNYRPYRSDVTLDIRQFEVALRRLRAFVREGAHVELDIERTIDETARNAGDIEIVVRPPSRPDTHLLLMIDVGGSMYPYSELMSQLFSATKKATHFKDLRTFYFHNCVYGKVYETDHFTDPIWVSDLLRRYPGHYKLIMIGDAFMADYELGMRAPLSPGDRAGISGIEWLHMLAHHYPQSVWLNPENASRWRGTTIERIGSVFDMYPMTIDGITDAMARLNRRSRARR